MNVSLAHEKLKNSVKVNFKTRKHAFSKAMKELVKYFKERECKSYTFFTVLSV